MKRESFLALKNYIESHLGIKIPESKQIMLESRLAKRLRALNLKSYEEYCEYVFGPKGYASEIQMLIDTVTTNETDFFREPSHYDLLTKKILPSLIENYGLEKINIWSVAAATGQEAYTLAMVMENFLQNGQRVSYRILATDISETVLHVAQTGIYTEHQAAKIPTQLKLSYCSIHKDPSIKTIRFKPFIRNKISFQKLNLMDAEYRITKEYHIVFCRNVFIYFDRPTQERVLTNIYQHIAPGGYLFMGHAESIHGISLPLQNVGPAAYRKPLEE